MADLGVLVPIAVALVVTNGLSTTAVLLPAGLTYLLVARVYRLPVAVRLRAAQHDGPVPGQARPARRRCRRSEGRGAGVFHAGRAARRGTRAWFDVENPGPAPLTR